MGFFLKLRNKEIDTQAAGAEFELTCAELLRKRGFKRIRVTQESRDQGADILAWKKGYKYAIQCKLYGRPVGNKAVQEVYAAKTYYGCDKAAVMTNNTFTSGAVDLAEMTDVELWGETPTKVRRRLLSVKKLLVLMILLLFVVLIYKYPAIVSRDNAPVTVSVVGLMLIIALWFKYIFQNRANNTYDRYMDESEEREEDTFFEEPLDDIK